MMLVSACLAGLATNFKGGAWPRQDVINLVREGKAIPVCPEQLGGLPTPRPPAELLGGDGNDVLAGKARVVRRSGDDVTEHFIRGAEEVLRLALLLKPELILFKDTSPSCGIALIHDGTFTGSFRSGVGVTTALLQQHGFRFSDGVLTPQGEGL